MSGLTAALLGPLLAGDPHRPRLTWHGAGGARTELSTASLANWSAKVAGLLVDELGGRPGDTVFVGVRPGWQTLPILLGTWWAGLVVTDVDDGAPLAAFVPDGADPALGAADEVFVVSGHPLGAPSHTVAAHQRDFTGAVLPQADRFSPRSVLAGDAPVVSGSAMLTVDDGLGLARLAAGQLGSQPRVLSMLPWTLPVPGLPLLAGVLAADGALVQVEPTVLAELDVQAAAEWLAATATAERITHTAGLDLPGLARFETGS